jgi:hypothetical protein
MIQHEIQVVKRNLTDYMRPKKYDYLKDAIRKKYGSIVNFSKMTGIRYSVLTNFFAYRLIPSSEEKTLIAINDKLSNDVNLKKLYISDDERIEVRKMIFGHYKNVKAFSTKYPQFSNTFIGNVLNGVRRIKDAKFLSLVNLLKIHISDEQNTKD